MAEVLRVSILMLSVGSLRLIGVCGKKISNDLSKYGHTIDHNDASKSAHNGTEVLHYTNQSGFTLEAIVIYLIWLIRKPPTGCSAKLHLVRVGAKFSIL